MGQGNKPISAKKYTTAVILSGLFGLMGIHHFYVKRWAMGLLDLGLFLATIFSWIYGALFLFWTFLIIDLTHTVYVSYLLLVGRYKDGDGKRIPYHQQKI